MDPILRARAVAASGVLIRRDALRLGSTDRDLRRAVGSGDLVRVRRDAYVLGDVWAGGDPTARLLLRTRAVLRSRGRPADAASHASALAARGLPTFGRTSVDLVTEVGQVLRRSGVVLRPRLDLPVESVRGIPSVGASTAIAQVTVDVGSDAGLAALDAALRARMVRADEVAAAGEVLARTGEQRRRLAEVIEYADGSSESVGESRTRLLLRQLGYQVRSQATIADADGFVARVDFLVEGRLVVEFDGAVKYGGADGRSALVREKRREDRLRRLGLRVLRLTWPDLDHPERIARLLREALA